MEILIILGVIVAILWFVYFSKTKYVKRDFFDGAVLHEVEKTLKSSDGQVIGRLDRIYKSKYNHFFPVEYKTRSKFDVYYTDKVQLSLQSWLLEENGYPIESFGYVVMENPKTSQKQVQKVFLMDKNRCLSLISRHKNLLAGKIAPKKERGNKCRSCGHAKNCFDL